MNKEHITIINNKKYIENLETGVIYKITNTKNNKIYIGKTYSYVGSGKLGPQKYGSIGRLKRHISNVFSKRINANNDCPSFYKAIKEYGKDNFVVSTLIVCKKNELKKYETFYISKYNSYLPEVGYNIFIGDNKPIKGANKIIYENNKIISNKKRCENGAQRQSNETKKLPANIYRVWRTKKDAKYLAGYKIQIKINEQIFSKGFTQNELSLEKKLSLAKNAKNKIKLSNS